MIFKCRCANYIDQHTTGVWLMSGTWKVHDNSFVWHFKHTGLNRLRYRLVNVDEWLDNTDPEKEDLYWEPVMRRRAEIKYHFRRKGLKE